MDAQINLIIRTNLINVEEGDLYTDSHSAFKQISEVLLFAVARTRG